MMKPPAATGDSRLFPVPGRSGDLAGSSAFVPFLLLLLGIALSLPFANLRFALPADTLWLMHVAEGWLAGATPYADAIETNPPMSVLLYVPAALAAQWLGVDASAAVVAQTLIIAVAASAFFLALSAAGLGLRILSAAALAAVLIVLPNNQFSQREHFALMLMLPYLCALARSAAGGAEPSPVLRMAAGVAAGLAAAIKPHFLLVPLFASLGLCVLRRSVRPLFRTENWIGAGVFAIYWLIVWLFFPQFFSIAGPILVELYLHERTSLTALLFSAYMSGPFWLAVALAAGFAWLNWQRRELLILLPGACGFGLAFLAQGKGYIYHLYPMLGLLAFAAFALAARRDGVADAPRSVLGALIAALLLLTGTLAQREAYPMPDLARMLRQEPPGQGMIVISESLHRSIAMTEAAGMRWDSRLHTRWMSFIGMAETASGAVTPERRAVLDRYAALDLRILAEDIARNQPAFIVFDHVPRDWRELATAYPPIAAALSRYRFAGRYDDGRMSLYRRLP